MGVFVGFDCWLLCCGGCDCATMVVGLLVVGSTLWMFRRSTIFLARSCFGVSCSFLMTVRRLGSGKMLAIRLMIQNFNWLSVVSVLTSGLTEACWDEVCHL